MCFSRFCMCHRARYLNPTRKFKPSQMRRFEFFGDACGVSRQTAVCRGSNLSLDLSSKDDKSACILVFMRTARGLFLYTRIPSVWRRNTPNLWGIRDNLPALSTWQIYSLSPRPEIRKAVVIHGFNRVWCRKRGVLYSKMHGM